ncbi:hypothetical protein N8Y96_02470, partial [Saprospiraceae bacterium]|nr:hypothetical protein [Saprospiraceae bacterium]
LQLSDDMIEYQDLVVSGEIYKVLGEMWSMDRNVAKLKLLALCNTPPKMLDNKFWNGFMEKFPTIANMILNLNKEFKTIKKGKGKNKRMEGDAVCAYAHLTQAVESHFVLDLISMKLNIRYPDLEFITLHDAFYFPDTINLNEVKGFISDIFFETVKLRPSISHNYYNPK